MRRGLAALALLATAACGTTIPAGDQSAMSAAPVGSDALGAPTTTGSEAAAGPGAAPDAVPGGSPLTTTAPGSSRSTTSGGTNAGGGASAPGTGNARTPGTSKVARSTAPVRVGVLYIDGAEKTASALGISGLSTGDAVAQAKAVIAWVNANGGLAGRRVAASFGAISASESTNNPQLAQERACQKLTQDDKVEFVVSYVNLLEATMACFAKGGARVIDDQIGLADEIQAKYAGQLAAPGDFAPGRMLRQMVEALWSTGWLNSKSVVGSYRFDVPGTKELVTRHLEPALAAHGLKLVKDVAVSNGADGVSQSQSAALQYRSEGVDRIIPVAANPLFLMQGASSQGYRPRYALYSSLGPGALMETAAPRDQLEGASGIGWSPYLDIGAGTKPGPVSANETLCFDIYAKAGQSSSSATTKGLQLNLCSVILYLKHAADRVGAVGPDLLVSARRAVGTSFRPADTFRSDVSTRTDGAAAYRVITYQSSCRCFQYTTPVRPAS